MCRGNFQGTRSKFLINIFIKYDRNFSVDQWNNDIFPFQVGISFIRWIYTNSRISHDCFGTLCGNVIRSLKLSVSLTSIFVNYFI